MIGRAGTRPEPAIRDNRHWSALGGMILLLVQAFVLSDWLFQISKPSFMSFLPTAEKFLMPWCAALPLQLVAAATVVLPMRLLAWLFPRAWVQRLLSYAWIVLPASLLAAGAFLLIDNFTYVIFEFGVINTTGVLRSVYGLGLVGLFVASYLHLYRRIKNASPRELTIWRMSGGLAVGAGLVALVLRLLLFGSPSPPSWDIGNRADPAANRPNIILFSTDGLNADHCSIYGSQFDTTPFLKSIAPELLICKNAFSNADTTGASVTSMLTGRLPTELRVIYNPDILQGTPVYQHLPGLLRAGGYRNLEVTIRHWADAKDLNMHDAFDRINGEDVDPRMERLVRKLSGPVGINAFHLLHVSWQRLADRVLHVLGLRPMDDFLKIAMGRVTNLKVTDEDRMEELEEFIESGTGPFFAHVQLFGTHGPYYSPRHKQFFRKDLPGPPRPRDVESYRDSILDFDGYIKRLYDYLKVTGKLDETIIVIHSDHTQMKIPWERIPLLFRFPHAEHAGSLHANAQLLDVGPTLLQALRIPKPAWMGGVPLIDGMVPALRPIFCSRRNEKAIRKVVGQWQGDASLMKPPFFQLGELSLVLANQWLTFKVGHRQVDFGQVYGHTGDESRDLLVNGKALMLSHLRQSGYPLNPEEALSSGQRSWNWEAYSNVEMARQDRSLWLEISRIPCVARFPSAIVKPGDAIGMMTSVESQAGRTYQLSASVTANVPRRASRFSGRILIDDQPFELDVPAAGEQLDQPFRQTWKAGGSSVRIRLELENTGHKPATNTRNAPISIGVSDLTVTEIARPEGRAAREP